MAEISRAALFGKLNSVMYQAIERAVVLCRLRSNPYIQLEHLLNQMIELESSDLKCICGHFGLDDIALKQHVNDKLGQIEGGAKSVVDIHDEICDAIERGWVYGTLLFRSYAVRSGHLIVGILKTQRLKNRLLDISSEFSKINLDELTDDFQDIVNRSAEVNSAAQDGSNFTPFSQAKPQREIFLCYRRAEARHIAGRIFDYLEHQFGNERIFKDVNSISLGTMDFENEIKMQLDSTKVMLVLIGPQWLTMRDESGRRRLDSKEDYVYIEVKTGLSKQIPLIPLLFDEAKMPGSKSLPSALRALSKCQAMEIRPDPNFQNDMSRLIIGCKTYVTLK